MSKSSGLLALILAAAPLGAQVPPFDSHQVNADGSITFRFFAPHAREVKLELDYDHDHPIPLAKEQDGPLWSVTTGPLQPSLHTYVFDVNGISLPDPLNLAVDNNYAFWANLVWVHGKTPQLWEANDVPHGVIHHHLYHSNVILGLEQGIEDFYVYTPPGYDPAGSKDYPVLYLLHGWSSGAAAWTANGQANYILDNLIAQGRVKPMVVVMPQGYGDMSFVLDGFAKITPSTLARNRDLYSQALLTEIMPQVEAAYRVRKDPDGRAIAGLSMGGEESLIIGLRHPELFSWIGGFSSAVIYSSYDGLFSSPLAQSAAKLKLLWIACGTEDVLIGPNRNFIAWLRTQGLSPTAIETPGIHNWPVWRYDLIHFAPLLFGGP